MRDMPHRKNRSSRIFRVSSEMRRFIRITEANTRSESASAAACRGKQDGGDGTFFAHKAPAGKIGARHLPIPQLLLRNVERVAVEQHKIRNLFPLSRKSDKKTPGLHRPGGFFHQLNAFAVK